MILIDYNQIFLSSIFSHFKQSENFDEDLVRHIVISNIRTYRNRWGREFGEIVICCDGRNYWRKTIFRYYKANRKKSREKSGLDWTHIHESLKKIRQELKDNMPYKVIEVDTAEADDVIAILCKTFSSREKILIISGDRDFVSLQKYENVKQFSPGDNGFIEELNPDEYLKHKIISGDRGDGIPNILSDDDSLVTPGKRQSKMTGKRKEFYFNSLIENYEENILKNYKRNEQLIDLSFIPIELEKNIIVCFNEQFPTRKNVMKYFIQNRMNLLLEHLTDF